MKDFTGTRFNFTVTGGIADTVRLLLRERTGDSVDLEGSTWCGVVVSAAGEVSELVLEHGSGVGELLMTVPALSGGTYEWELYAQGETQERRRVLYGEVVAVTSHEAATAMQKAERTDIRELLVTLPAGGGRVWEMQWMGTTLAHVYALQAQQAAASVMGMGDILNAGVKAAEEALRKALEATDKLEDLDDLLESFRREINNQIWISDAGTWVIGGEDTCFPAQGPAGRDGGAILRIRVASVDDIPDDAEAMERGAYYYVESSDGTRTTYCWMREKDGSYALVQVSDPVDFATSQVYGMVKLSTDIEVTGGGSVIGKNAAGQIMVPRASEASYGALRLGTRVIQKEAVPYLLAPGQDREGRLSSNLLKGGCLRSHNATYWNEAGLPGIPELDAAQSYLGLFTSDQFEQSATRGLCLRAATEGRLGGVYMCEHLDDANPNAVLASSTLVDNFSTSEEVAAAISEAVDELKAWVLREAQAEGEMPVGFISWAGVAEKEGWLLCNGSEVERDAYPRLFDAIGTRFGTPSSNTLFKLPDLRERVAWGAHGDLGSYKLAGLPDHAHSVVTPTKYGARLNANTGIGWCVSDVRVHDAVAIATGNVEGNWIYGRSTTVQPPALALNAFIKY